MTVNTGPSFPNNVSRTLVCIDVCENADFFGRLYNPYIKNCYTFRGFYDMINAMEVFFDSIGFPQAFVHYRSFKTNDGLTPTLEKKNSSPSGEGLPLGSSALQACISTDTKEITKIMDDDIFQNETGRKATFIVQVQYRQNASWQGTVSWTDEKKTHSFRSTLELVKLMDSAMGGSDTPPPSWDK